MAHEPEAVSPVTEAGAKPKRQVSYNQDVVLCPACKKRIRLNNSGRMRVHSSGKIGSEKCVNSDAVPLRVNLPLSAHL